MEEEDDDYFRYDVDVKELLGDVSRSCLWLLYI